MCIRDRLVGEGPAPDKIIANLQHCESGHDVHNDDLDGDVLLGYAPCDAEVKDQETCFHQPEGTGPALIEAYV